MSTARYKYGFIDLSYLLSRNAFACQARNPYFTAGDVIQLTIQTLNKISRDFGITVEKFVFLRDQWDKQLNGYYRTFLLPKGEYKGTRKYMTREEFERISNDPTTTPEELEKATKELYFNETKTKAKWEMIRELGKFGVPTLSVEAWECDDLAYLAGAYLMGEDPDPKKSVVITKDSDIQYSITPKMDYFKIPTGGSAPQVITYDEMWNSLPPEVQCLPGMSLYEYHAIWESIGQGHNDMVSCKKPYADPVETIIQCFQGDFRNLDDCELYLKHKSTFDLGSFPRFHEAVDLLRTKLGSIGTLGTVEEFRNFCANAEISGISDRYYSNFISRLNPELYRNA